MDVPELARCSNDVATLANLDDKHLLDYVKCRYEDVSNGWETWVGNDVLVVVNPYTKSSEQNDHEVWEKLRRCGMDYLAAPPHPYSMAAKAVQRMMRASVPVFVIVSGESGTGKTHSSRLMMEYVVQCCTRSTQSNRQPELPNCADSNKWLDGVLCTNPLLEAFGNAATTRNNNSSRFGKLTVMHLAYPERHMLRVSAACLTKVEVKQVLLGTSRLTNLPANDRSFHILHGTQKVFQQLWDDYKEEFAYLQPVRDLCVNLKARCLGRVPEPDIEGDRGTRSPEDWFCYVARSLKEFLNVPEKDICDIFSAMMGAVALLDVDFVENGAATNIKPDTQPALQAAADLLKMPAADLANLLVKRKKRVNKATVDIKNDKTRARGYASSLARSTYTLVFERVVSWVNKSLNSIVEAPTVTVTEEKEVENEDGSTRIEEVQVTKLAEGWESSQIGIVDIYGFEDFENNTFEQFLINYFNEHQHQLFMNEMILSEKLEYQAEGVAIPREVDIALSNGSDAAVQDRIECLNGLVGNLSTMTKDYLTVMRSLKDDSIQVRDAVQKLTIQGINQPDRKIPREVVRKFLGMPKGGRSVGKSKTNGFMVSHYAGQVSYNPANFIDSNKNDALAAEGIRHLSAIPFISENTRPASVGATSLVDPSSFVANSFLSEINGYRNMLEGAAELFVRCVGPSKAKGEIEFEEPHVQRQLKCMGLFESSKIRSRGYPTRIGYLDLYKRILPMLDPKLREVSAAHFLSTGVQIQVDGDQQSAKIFIELVVKAMESDEFQIVMKQTCEAAFGQDVQIPDDCCKIKLGEDVVLGKKKLFCRPNKAHIFEYIKAIQEQYPEHIDALASLISQHVNIVRMREERERNIKKRLTWLSDFVESYNLPLMAAGFAEIRSSAAMYRMQERQNQERMRDGMFFWTEAIRMSREERELAAMAAAEQNANDQKSECDFGAEEQTLGMRSLFAEDETTTYMRYVESRRGEEEEKCLAELRKDLEEYPDSDKSVDSDAEMLEDFQRAIEAKGESRVSVASVVPANVLGDRTNNSLTPLRYSDVTRPSMVSVVPSALGRESTVTNFNALGESTTGNTPRAASFATTKANLPPPSAPPTAPRSGSKRKVEAAGLTMSTRTKRKRRLQQISDEKGVPLEVLRECEKIWRQDVHEDLEKLRKQHEADRAARDKLDEEERARERAEFAEFQKKQDEARKRQRAQEEQNFKDCWSNVMARHNDCESVISEQDKENNSRAGTPHTAQKRFGESQVSVSGKKSRLPSLPALPEESF